MILIRYSKLKGAEFIPHLDTLKHLTKILRRAKIKVNYSKGFSPHVLIYMSSPIALGLKSESEYCLIDTNESAVGFKEKFNAYSPKGIKCEEVFETDKKVGVASDIVFADYEITGLNYFDVNEVMTKKQFFVIDKKGTEKEVRDKIISLKFDKNKLIARLKFGNDTLRPDYLAIKLCEIYGGEHIDIFKKSVGFKGNVDAKTYLENLQCR